MANSSSFKGFSSVDSSIKKTNWTDLDLIKRDLVNAFYTRVGERVMNPTFGCIIWDLLYEPMTDLNVQAIESNCLDIVAADGRVTAQDFNLIQLDNSIQLGISLYYAPLNLVDQFTINFNQDLAAKASG